MISYPTYPRHNLFFAWSKEKYNHESSIKRNKGKRKDREVGREKVEREKERKSKNEPQLHP